LKNFDKDSLCSSCNSVVQSHDGILVGQKSGEYDYLCTKCYNESIAEYLGINFEHISFEPITVSDTDGVEHTFHFSIRLLPNMVIIRAVEMKEGIQDGYEFHVNDDAEEDLFYVFKKLFEKIKRAMKQKHIRGENSMKYEITDEGVVRGYITSSLEDERNLPLLVIDGKNVTWDEFGKMLTVYEGFNFKMEIFDKMEEE
jgi:hypothetical protein